jgi:hypothetical protein
MRKFELTFPSVFHLCEFIFLTFKKTFNASLKKRTLVCQCTESEIELARLAFNADIKCLR